MDELDQIKKFIKESPQGTIFSTPEWLEAVAPGNWEYLKIQSDHSIEICMPIVLSNKMGFKFCNMPPFTQSLGIILPKQQGKYAKMLSRETNSMLNLISLIPKNSYFRQRFHPSLTNWLPFYWNQYSQSTKYTYIIEDLTNIEDVWRGIRTKKHQEIRKAENKLKIHETRDFDTLKFCIESTYARQNKKGFNFKILENIFIACDKLNCSKIFIAKNNLGDIAGSVFIVWDKKSAYYLAGGSPVNLRNSGAIPLLLWHSIKFASKITKQFNFEGSMIKPIEYFFRAFGGKQTPYLEITKINSNIISIYKMLGL